MRRYTCCVLAILLSLSCTSWAQQQTTIPGSAAAARIAWWRDAKFGLFLHWVSTPSLGVVSGFNGTNKFQSMSTPSYRSSFIRISLIRMHGRRSPTRPV